MSLRSVARRSAGDLMLSAMNNACLTATGVRGGGGGAGAQSKPRDAFALCRLVRRPTTPATNSSRVIISRAPRLRQLIASCRKVFSGAAAAADAQVLSRDAVR